MKIKFFKTNIKRNGLESKFFSSQGILLLYRKASLGDNKESDKEYDS